MREIKALSLGLLLIAVFIAPPATVAAPEAEPVEEEDGPPPVSSPWRTQQFDAPLERVRSELLALMREDGLEPAGEETRDGTFITGLVDFDDERFGADVSIPPPRLSARYPYAQVNVMTSGRYGLEGRLTMVTAAKTRLDLRALLETWGVDRKANRMRWIPRLSNGEIERQYFTRLALQLLKPPDGSPPSR